MFDDESPSRLLIGIPGLTTPELPDEHRQTIRNVCGAIWRVWAVLLALGLLYGIGVSFCHVP